MVNINQFLQNLLNSPYNKFITSNIGREFLNLITKYFPSNSPLAKIINKNNIKVVPNDKNHNHIHQQYNTSL